jgi:hypothetical protein
VKAGQFNNITPTKKMQCNIFKNRLKVKTTLNEYIRVSQRTSGIFLHRIVVVWQQAVKHKVGAFCEVKKNRVFAWPTALTIVSSGTTTTTEEQIILITI